MAAGQYAVALAYRQASKAALPQRRYPEAALTGVLTYIGRAERCIAAADMPGAHAALIAAQEIVAMLRGALDHTAGGELAERLDALYGFLLAQLMRANIEKDARRLERLPAVIEPLRSAFARAAQSELARGGGPST